MKTCRLLKVQGLLPVILAVLLLSPLASAVDEVTFSNQSGVLSWWEMRDVVVVGDYAYCALANAMVVFDVSDPASPEQVAIMPLAASGLLHIAVKGNIACLGGNVPFLHLIDISDPMHPALASQFPLYEEPGIETIAWDIEIVGDYVFVCARGNLEIIDIVDPKTPRVAVVVPDTRIASGIDIKGDTLYFTASSGLKIFELTDPLAPLLIGEELEPPGDRDWYSDVKVVGHFAFRTRANQPMFVYDVSNPADPELVSTSFESGSLFECETAESLLFIADGHYSGAVVAVDVADPAAPALRSRYEMPGWLGDLAVVGPTLYVANGHNGIQVMDASNPDNLTISSAFSIPYWGETRDVALSGDYAYVASLDSGVQIVDVANYSVPVRVAGFRVPGRIDHVATAAGRLYCTRGPLGNFQIYDLADPQAPVLIGQGAPTAAANDLVVAGRYLYLVDGDLKIFDLEAQPNDAVLVATRVTPGTAMGVTVAGNWAFVADSDQGLAVVDVTNPGSPTPGGTVALPGLAQGVVVSGNHAYVAAGAEGLQIVDVVDPMTPVLIGACNTPGLAHSVVADGDYALVADGFAGLQVINISNPTTPYLYIAGNLSTFGETLRLASVNGRAYVADRYQLLTVEVSTFAGEYTLGDVDYSGTVTSSDVIGLVNFVFKGGSPPQPTRRAGDVNCDGPITSTDIISLVNYVFKGGPAPECP